MAAYCAERAEKVEGFALRWRVEARANGHLVQVVREEEAVSRRVWYCADNELIGDHGHLGIGVGVGVGVWVGFGVGVGVGVRVGVGVGLLTI